MRTEADVTLHYYDGHRLQIEAEEGLAQEIADNFSFFVKGYRYMPTFRKGIWDGKKRLVNMRNQTAPIGLWREICSFCESIGKTTSLDERLQQELMPRVLEAGAVESFIGQLKLEHEPRDFQLAAIKQAIKNRRITIKSPTGSGKSQIMYVTHRFHTREPDRKTLIVVPNTKLVEQLKSDFKDYSKDDNNWDATEKAHVIYSGKEKVNLVADVFIATWQSVVKLPPRWLDQFSLVIVDEAHTAKAQSLEQLLSNCRKTTHRVGLTGTIEDEASKYQIIGGLGPIFEAASTSELQDRGILAKLTVYCIVLNYHVDDCKLNRGPVKKKPQYQDELKFILSHKPRHQFLVNLALGIKGNRLILVNNRDTHVVPLYEELKQRHPKPENVFTVHGEVGEAEAEQIRQTLKGLDDSITAATYGSFQVGINVPSLSSLIFGFPSKSEIRVLQSIGRVLRIDEGKDSAYLYDVVDNLTYKRKKNFAMRHFEERLKYYNREGFRVKFVEVTLKRDDSIHTEKQVNLLESL